MSSWGPMRKAFVAVGALATLYVVGTIGFVLVQMTVEKLQGYRVHTYPLNSGHFCLS
mgnify:CR=1 FL=1